MSTRPSLLIVDDEIGPAESLRMIFKSRYDVLLASDAETALAILRSQRIDVITLDLQMPSMPGMELLQAFRAVDPQVEVVLVTGCPVSEDAVRDAAANGVHYVGKPFDVAHARNVVELAMARRDRNPTTSDQDWLAGFAHDIRTPVAAIVGYGEILSYELASTLDEHQRSALQRIQANADLLLHLMDCAYVAKGIEQGTFTPRPSAFDMADLLRQVVTQLLPVAKDQTVQVSTDLPSDELLLVTDREAIRLALWTIIEVCLKHAPSGQLSLRAHPASANAAALVIRVRGHASTLHSLHEALAGHPVGSLRRPKLRWVRRLIELLGGSMHTPLPSADVIEVVLNLSSQLPSDTGVSNDDPIRTDNIHRLP